MCCTLSISDPLFYKKITPKPELDISKCGFSVSAAKIWTKVTIICLKSYSHHNLWQSIAIIMIIVYLPNYV